MLETAIGARYRRYQRAVGLLILATLGVLFVLLWMANRQLGFFSHTYRLHGFLDNVRNLRQTTPVTLAGLKIGEVRDLAITDYNQIRIELLLYREYQPRIRADSTARIKTDALGNATVELNMGDPARPVLGDDATIPFQRAPDLEAVMHQAQEQLGQIGVVLANVKAITDELKRPEGALLGTLNTFAQVMRELTPLLRNLTATSQEMSQLAADLAVTGGRIRAGQGALGGLTDSASPLSRQIAASAQKLQAMMTGLEALAVRLPGYGERVERILRQTEAITAKLAKASAQVPDLMDRSRGVAESVDEVVDSVKRSAVLRALSPAPDAPDRPLLEAPRDWDPAPPGAPLP
ncbi:MAG: MlaD family protein [Candidatus Contendobacter sp.]|nr:MlaD family protein [Candidatus Contendobacter sp.]MDG4556134.1 MlaD family protein [Candidatus Contendobacter sp.]